MKHRWYVLVTDPDGSNPERWGFYTRREARDFARGYCHKRDRHLFRISVRKASS